MTRYAQFIEQHLTTGFYRPDSAINPYHLRTMLVLGNELASRINTDEGQPGDCGRLVQNVSNKLGIAICAYERLGTGKRLSLRAQRMIRKALRPEEYTDTMADVGAEIRRRVHEHTKRNSGIDRVIVVGKSAGGTSGIALVHSNTIAADSAVFMDPAGMHDMGNTLQAVQGFMRYKKSVESTITKPRKPPAEITNAEPVSILRQMRDYWLNGQVGSSDLPLRQLQATTVPTIVDIPEFGMYSNVPEFSTAGFVDELNGDNYPEVHGYLRRAASHDWYNGSPEYAEAVRHGLIMLGRWGLDTAAY
jgi:hypothetical protein